MAAQQSKPPGPDAFGSAIFPNGGMPAGHVGEEAFEPPAGGLFR
jgi:hypothetical protein